MVMAHILGIDLVTLLVTDLDETIAFYVDTLGFELHQDEAYGDDNRWVELRPPGSDTTITLKTPSMFSEDKADHAAGLNLGSIPQLTFEVDTCEALYEEFGEAGVQFEAEPDTKPWGTSMTARDPSGNPVVFTQRL